MIKIIRLFINLFKLDIKKHPNLDLRRREKLLNEFGINKIIDVGANSGQYAKETFKLLNFKGKIVSFEPLSNVFSKLEKATRNNKRWSCQNIALGDVESSQIINVSKNTYSSSLLRITKNHIDGAPESKVIGKEEIKIKTLDSIFDSIVEKEDVVFLKIDVQGFEKRVLEGAIHSLKKITGVQIEMSLVELYDGEPIFDEMINYMNDLGFKLYSLENGFHNNKDGRLLQVDGIFFKE